MTDLQSLGVNEQLLRGAKKDLARLENVLRHVDLKFMIMFPGKEEPWVRATMIAAKKADIAQYESLVTYYRRRLGLRG